MHRSLLSIATILIAFLLGVACASAQTGDTTQTSSTKKTASHKKKSTKAGTATKGKTAGHNCAPEAKTTPADQPGCGTHCGTERWPVKTVSDADADAVSTTSDPSTVADLVSQQAPSTAPPQNNRLDIEKKQVKLDVVLIGRKVETDKDFHLVIADPGDTSKTMIAEIPNTTCTGACKSKFLNDFKTARAALVKQLGQPTPRFVRLRTPQPVHIIGIPFFDFDHGQTGLAENCIEIHPVLSIAFTGQPSPSGGGHKKGTKTGKKKSGGPS